MFGRKKKASELDFTPNFESPRVLKWSIIKPTTCKLCKCVYQASHSDIVWGKVIGAFKETVSSTKCPVCEELNRVVFEEDENV